MTHGKVGALQQSLSVFSIVRTCGKPEARSNVEHVLADAMGPSQRREHSFRDDRVLRVSDTRKQDRKFIPTQMTDHIAVAHTGEQPLCDGLQQAIADRVAPRIVDVPEAIQIEEHYGQFLFLGLRRGDLLRQPLNEHRSIGQDRQAVVLRATEPLQREHSLPPRPLEIRFP